MLDVDEVLDALAGGLSIRACAARFGMREGEVQQILKAETDRASGAEIRQEWMLASRSNARTSRRVTTTGSLLRTIDLIVSIGNAPPVIVSPSCSAVCLALFRSYVALRRCGSSKHM